ncbi:LTA synthase family protein [Segatella oris]|uniref:LTA synthase family protein n=1 Tax=Segatella oris TaxID=28135 RepID=UPI0028E1AFF2|nr:LTA synthase family protein [Segatella oris]
MNMNDKKLIYRNPIYLIGTRFLKLYIIIGLILRIILMHATPGDASFSLGEIVRLLSIGIVSDFCMAILLVLPLLIIYLGLNERKYHRIIGWMIEILLIVSFVYVLFFHTIFHEYGGGAPTIARIFLGWKLFSFSMRFFFPKIRETWRRVSLYLTWAVYVFLFLCVTAGEYIFWGEFGVRYNFIAVDYLVYTHEVIGNIMESYAIIPMIGMTLLLTVGIIFLQLRHYRFNITKLYGVKMLIIHLFLYAVLATSAYFILWETHSLKSDNQYVTQLEQNGACDFVIAFQSNKLAYDQFYAMLPKQECISMYRQLSGLNKDGKKNIGDSLAANRPNIVLITVESLSADFLTRYGNKQNLTPRLDRLMQESLVFDSLFAAGNRTVRGLEALSLCLPPSAGESIIKRKANRMGNLSVGSVLSRLGYKSQFIYGGDSYFDNMGDFFSHNGYEVIDRKNIPDNQVTFANIWGVCDEDIFRKSLQVFDTNNKSGHPFFAQIMTTSNHRPYTYPAGKIKVNGDPNTREAAVKYTDYAIGKFIDDAKKKVWFKNTVFIVIADHCASSAGKTSLPIDRYHIPCLVYAPEIIQQGKIEKICSQIDLMPTVLSLLNLRSSVSFTGQDILAPTYHPRAFMATYQDLGYMEGNRLTVLSPVRNVQQYTLRPLQDGTYDEQPARKTDEKLVRKAQAYYQYTNLYVKAK